MIVIDGHQSSLSIKSFENLEQILIKVMHEPCLENRVVTDVLVNEESFSEIYPHQAEDIEVAEIEKLEIVSMGPGEMAVNITGELDKVITIMESGARKVADLFRQADDAEALEVYQDLMDVTRDFLGMIGVLRDEFGMSVRETLNENAAQISELFSEMLEVIENEDWILLADLLEYEFIPAVEKWKKVLVKLQADIAAS